jgi:hypothetical protein
MILFQLQPGPDRSYDAGGADLSVGRDGQVGLAADRLCM